MLRQQFGHGRLLHVQLVGAGVADGVGGLDEHASGRAAHHRSHAHRHAARGVAHRVDASTHVIGNPGPQRVGRVCQARPMAPAN